MLEFKVLKKEHMSQIVEERNKVLEVLRTPFMLNEDMQEKWYKNEICNRESKTRYWAIYRHGRFVGYGGIENIQWENRTGEISLLIFEEHRQNGYGKKAYEDIRKLAFDRLNLNSIWGECYECNKTGIVFWNKIAKEYNMGVGKLYYRKYYDGKFWDSFYFVDIRGN